MEEIKELDELNRLKLINEKASDEAYEKRMLINPSLPVEIQVIDSTRCNLHCTMCEWHRTKEIQEIKKAQSTVLPRDLLINLFDEIFPKLKYYDLTKMGEPLLSPNLDLIIDYCHRYNVKMNIITNGTIMNEELINKILPLTNSIQFSVDSHLKEVLEKIRCGVNYDNLIKNIKDFIKARNEYSKKFTDAPEIIIHSVLMRSNIEYLEDFIEFSYKLGADIFQAYHIYAFDESIAKESLMFHQELTNQHLNAAKKRAENLGMKVRLARPFWNGLGNKPQPKIVSCKWLWKYALIEYDGTVRSCPVPNHPIMGDLKTESFQSIWNNENYQSMRKDVLSDHPPKICEDCGERIHYIEKGAIPYKINRFIQKNDMDGIDGSRK